MGGEESRELLALAAAVGDVVALIDDDDVPAGVLEPGAVARVVLERIDGDDATVVVGEGVAVGGDLLLDAAQTAAARWVLPCCRRISNA